MTEQQATVGVPDDPGTVLAWWNDRVEWALYAVAIAVGGVLAVITAINQPYNQNEWAQIQPYDSWDPAVVTSGTRQPPLDPLLGALVQHAVGVGQLQQRIVPIVCGIVSLLLMALLLRRLRLGPHGVAAVWVMATAPLFLRYSAYIRPYALPVTLILLCAYAGTRWLETGSKRWLMAAFAAAFCLPLARVPEPVAFLASGAVLLLLAGWRGWVVRGRAWWLSGGLLLALGTVGALSTLRLSGATASRTDESLLDLDPGRALDRLPTGLRELWNFVRPLYADWFPWLPLTLLVVVTALALPASRRVLTRSLTTSWYWLPMVVGPLAFLVAYHTVNPYPLELRHYRSRFAFFWVPSLIVLVALASYAVSTTFGPRLRRGGTRVGSLIGPALGPLLVAALLLSQLPTSYQVLTRNDTIDVGGAAELIEREVPDDALVLYDGPAPVGYWRQPFFGASRYFGGDHARVLGNTTKIIDGSLKGGRRDGPIYLLLIDAECVSTVACDGRPLDWDGEVEGFEVVERFDRFTLYAPTAGQTGPSGLIEALLAQAEAYGPEFGVRNLAAAAKLLEDDGRTDESRALLQRACDQQQTAELADACRAELRKLGALSPR